MAELFYVADNQYTRFTNSQESRTNCVMALNTCLLMFYVVVRLISVEDIRSCLSHIIYILIFDFFLNFLLFFRYQDVGGRYNDIREAN